MALEVKKKNILMMSLFFTDHFTFHLQSMKEQPQSELILTKRHCPRGIKMCVCTDIHQEINLGVSCKTVDSL